MQCGQVDGTLFLRNFIQIMYALPREIKRSKLVFEKKFQFRYIANYCCNRGTFLRQQEHFLLSQRPKMLLEVYYLNYFFRMSSIGFVFATNFKIFFHVTNISNKLKGSNIYKTAGCHFRPYLGIGGFLKFATPSDCR